MIDFAKDALNAFPSPVLNSMQAGMQEGKALADSVFKDIMRRVFLDTGIVEYDTTLGRFVFVSTSSNLGVEQDLLQGMEDSFGLGKILGFGAGAWVIGENVLDQIDVIKNCIDKLTSYNALQKGASSVADKFVGFTAVDPVTGEPIAFDAPPPALEAASQVYDSNKATLEIAGGFVAAVDKQLQVIKEIQQARAADPINNPEPVFWANMPNPAFDPNLPSGPDNPATLREALDGKTSFTLLDAEADANGLPIVPPDYGGEFDPFTDVISASSIGAPQSKAGQFLFSRTGVYYDSYGGGLDYSGCITNIVHAIYYDTSGNAIPGTGVPPDAVKYLQEYNPNIGGRGEAVSWNTFNRWANTAFDIEHINESPQIQAFYDADHFLQVLMDQRNREIYDLSGYIGELQDEGYLEESAVLSNQRQLLYSKISAHGDKIKKRKKQVEVHVILAPANAPAVLGKIPINNFEALDGGLLAIEKAKQEHLIFQPGDVSGIVLPLCPSFIKSNIPQDTFTVEDLMVPTVGVGQIITSDFPVSGTSGTVLSLTDTITTDKIVAVYNFLDSDIVKPDSDKYLSINCTTSSAHVKPAQIVASSIDSMYPSGVGVPYFRGVCNFFSGVEGDGNPKSLTPQWNENEEYLRSASRPYGYGRIKTGSNDIDSLLYSSSGATFDFWTHVPDLGNANDGGWNADSSLSSLHRVVLGCENRGGTFTSDNPSWAVGPLNDGVVKGLLIGFTRDRRVTQGAAPSNNPADNDLENGLMFHMSPTQSINTSGVTLLSASASIAYCPQDQIPPSGYYGIAVDTSTPTAGGHTFNDCSTGFVHTSVTVDYGQDLVSIYLNGELLTSQTVNATFGAGEQTPPRIPSMVDTSSFSYDAQYKNQLPPNAPLFPPDSLGYRDFWYWNGPHPESAGTNVALTPWIVGGGYTDGMHTKEIGGTKGDTTGMNFMGGQWGGRKSGLFGFIGSLKLYTKALTAAEAKRNYDAQKGFFTNIRTYNY